ncbi:MAG: peptidoglycan editing factor PgeF [Anaerolineae bacterium]|nr:peptidoglycan editing factor PgeF [Anaerolineae bacterium]
MRRIQHQSLVYYQFDSLAFHPRVTHGIFTRLGGHSRPPWEGLNTGHSVGDDLHAIDANHLLICRALGFESEAETVSPYQVHGCRVAVVDGSHKGTVIEATDALIAQTPGVLLLLRFADCTPIVFYDPVKRAVGLAHAGWRGTVLKTAQAAARAMIEAFGCRAEDLIAGIGPSIGPCCYEVGADVAQAVEQAFPGRPDLLAERADGRWHFDMWAANRCQLEEIGVAHIELAGICTACHTDEWFSHRAEHGKTGRFAAAISLISAH